MKKVFVCVFCSIVLLFSGLVVAQEVVPDINEDIGGFIGFLISAFQAGNWWVVGGLVLMLGVWVLNKFVKIDPKWLPLVNATMGMLAGLVVGFIDTATPWYTDLWNGLLTSGTAALFWSTLGKRVLPTSKE